MKSTPSIHSRPLVQFVSASVTAILMSTSAYSQTDLTVTGKLTVNGDSDLCGNTLTMGRQSTPADFGIGVSYSDSGNGLASFYANRTTTSFAWTRKSASGSVASTLMILDASGNLSTSGSINTLPSQTLSGTSSILTMGLADGRYLLKGATSMIWGVGSSSGGVAGSIALGDGASAIGAAGSASIALGVNSRAQSSLYDGTAGIALGTNAKSGNPSDVGGGIAIGTNAYSKVHGTAIGRGCQATGFGAFSLGYDTIASGNTAVSLGYNNNSFGYASVALGNNVRALGHQQIVVGAWNIEDVTPTASPDLPAMTDNCFVVGNGVGTVSSPPIRSNAFEIKWNGDAKMIGNATVTKNLTVALNATVMGNETVQGASTVTGQTNGTTARFTGQVSVAGASGILRTPERGGISMGEFTSGGAPQ